MTTVEFGKRDYHRISEMCMWLRENIGPGGYAPVLDAKWKIESAFGNTMFTFKEEKHASMFALKWKFQ